MQEEKINTAVEQEEQKPNLNIGALLVNARNSVALNQTDVADQINLPLATIDALEKDNFEKLPESTYVRGYLRSYARLVGLDPEELINNYNGLYPAYSDKEQVTSFKPSYDSAFIWSTAAVVIILVGLLVTWWIDFRTSSEQDIQLASSDAVQSISTHEAGVQSDTTIPESKIEVEPETVSEATPESEPEVIIEQQAVATAEPVIMEGPVPVEDEVVSAEPIEYATEEVEQAMEEESQDPTLVTMSHDSDILTVTFVEKSWTEIQDADSNTLMQGLIEPGVVKNLNGRPPFRIFLGNSPGVVIEVNGQYFDQSEFNRSNRTARFQVSGRAFN